MMLRRLALAIGLICGLLGTQGPEFAQQYRQRMAGAIDELSRVVTTFQDEAASHSLTPAEAIQRLKSNDDPLARERGADIESDIARLDRLKLAFAAFQDSAILRRLMVLASNFDPKTAAETWKDYEPAVPTSIEAFVVGGGALIWGWASTHLFAWPIRRHLQKRKERLAQASS